MMKRLLIFIFAVHAMYSCSLDVPDRPAEHGDISFPVETRSSFGADDRKIPSTVLVAGASDYASMADAGLGSPLCECSIPDIYEWSGRFYNTHVHYPEGDEGVCIFGYAPCDRLSTDDAWKTLTPDYPASVYDNSVWGDMLIAGPLASSLDSPVGQPLAYRHPVARFRFIAFKAQAMAKYPVRDVVLTADASLTPYRLAWDASDGIWKAQGDGHESLSLTFKDNMGVSIIGCGEESATEMFPYYIVPQEDGTVGPFSIEATYYIEGDESYVRTHEKTGVFFHMDSGSILPGHDYTVTIRFNQDSFTLFCSCMDEWEDGGNIIVPVINETVDW